MDYESQFRKVRGDRKNKREQKERMKRDIEFQFINLMKIRIRTAMIGALAQFEESFPEIVDSDQWERVRSKILRNGNDQIRQIPIDFNDVDITPKYREWKIEHFRED